MATANDTNQPTRDVGDLIDLLHMKSCQLRALLVNTYGQSGDGFRSMADHLQDQYMWTCNSLADEIVEALDKYIDQGVAQCEVQA